MSNAIQFDFEDSLIAHWQLDDMTISDSTSNGNNGTVSGNPVIVEGKRGKALRFDGNDYINISTEADGMGKYFTRDFTIAAWVKPESITGRRTIVGVESTSKFYISGYEGFTLELEDGKPVVYIANNHASRDIVRSDTVLSINQWYHIAVSRNNTTVKFYLNVDGVKSLSTGTATNRDINFYTNKGYGYDSIGNTHDYINGGRTSNYFIGIIDDVRLYNQALSEGEIAKLVQETTIVPAPLISAPKKFMIRKQSD